jgi:hypothetical protein
MNTELGRGSPDTRAESILNCPFVYANGRKCAGKVSGWRVYGGDGSLPPARKVRLWCSDKWDHAGNGDSGAAKERMEFYPDRLPRPICEAVFAPAIAPAP